MGDYITKGSIESSKCCCTWALDILWKLRSHAVNIHTKICISWPVISAYVPPYFSWSNTSCFLVAGSSSEGSISDLLSVWNGVCTVFNRNMGNNDVYTRHFLNLVRGR